MTRTAVLFTRKALIVPIWLLSLLLTAGGAGAGIQEAPPPTAVDWLTEMRRAVAELSYKGVIAYLRDKEVDSFQLFHSAGPGTEQERLVSMNSPLREVVRNAEKVTCYFPDTRTVFVESKPAKRSVLLDIPADMVQLSRYYRVGLQGQETIARRLAQVVSIEPRDGYRYARLVWVDTDSKLPLKFELLDEDGQTVEQVMFTTLSVEQSIPREELEPSVPADSFAWRTNVREVLPLASLRWTLQNVPEGFQIISYTRMNRPPDDHPVEHILMSDSFSSVSIYIEEKSGVPAKEHPRKVGAIHADSIVIDGHLVTVMGEVPERTVEAIAKGLRYRDGIEP